MTLPSTGAISLNDINNEFGRGTNLNSYRGTTWYTDAGSSGTFPSGAIDMDVFRGKRATSPLFAASISSNQQDLNLRTWAVNNGWDGNSAVQITIPSTVYISSTSTSIPALTINGSWPGGITLTNNGYILGRGGDGGAGGQVTNVQTNALVGGTGGTGISIGVSCSITNNGTIGGGGGGGGGGAGGVNTNYGGGGGGGGGGYGTGAARLGQNGTATAGGSGGAPGTGIGGAGGSLGASGSAGGNYTYAFFSLVVTSYGAAGGSAGPAINKNSNTVSVTNNGTISGAII